MYRKLTKLDLLLVSEALSFKCIALYFICPQRCIL